MAVLIILIGYGISLDPPNVCVHRPWLDMSQGC
jgi:hypothetical protein